MLQNPGGLDRLGVMSRAPGRLGDPQEPAGQVGDDLEVHPGPPVLAREEPLFAVPVPTRGKSAVDDHLLGGVEVLHCWDELVENLAESGFPAGDDPADRGLPDAEALSKFAPGSGSVWCTSWRSEPPDARAGPEAFPRACQEWGIDRRSARRGRPLPRLGVLL